MIKSSRINHYVSIIGFLALIPIVVLGVYLTSDTIQRGKNIREQHEIHSHNLALDVKTFLDTYVVAIDTLAKQTQGMEMSPTEIKRVLFEVPSNYPGFSEIYYENLAYQISTKTAEINDAYRNSKAEVLYWYIEYPEFIMLEQPYLSPVISKPNGERCLFLAFPLYEKGSESYGYIMATIDMPYLEELLAKRSKIYASSYNVLADQRGEMIVYPQAQDDKVLLDMFPVMEALNENKSGSIEYYSSVHKQKELASYFTIDDYGWSLWTVAHLSEVIMPQYKAAGLSFMLLLGAILLIWFIRKLLITNISQPLMELAYASNEISKGNLGFRVQLEKENLPMELVMLKDRFNAMALYLERSSTLLKKHNEDLEIRVRGRTQELVNKNQELQTLYTIAAAVSSTRQGLDVIEDVLLEMLTFFKVEIASVHLLEESLDNLPQSIFQITMTEQDKKVYADFIITLSEALRGNEKAVVISDLLRYEKAPRELISKQRLKSLLCVPILHKSDGLGMIILTSKVANRFGLQELTLLQTIANQLGVVLSNVALFNRINQEHNRFLAVMNSINEGLILIDPRGEIIYVNPIILRMFYIPEDSYCPGITIKDLIDRHDPEVRIELPKSELWGDFYDRKVFERRLGRVTYKEKTHYYQILGFPVYSASLFIGYGFVSRDYTREKEIDNLKNSILSTVSHELRTPLTSIRGSAESLLRKDVKWTAKEKEEFVLAIAEESKGLRDLIDNIMDMSKIEAGSLRLDLHPVDIRIMIERVMEQQQTRHPQALLIKEFPSALPQVMLDVRRMEQVLNNLVENAIKYSPVPAEVTLWIDYLEDRDVMKVGIRDRGIGIEARYYKAIFERFYRVNSSMEKVISGSGVGLAIAKGIVEAHGGIIWVESQIGQGSTFYFTVPCGQKREGQ